MKKKLFLILFSIAVSFGTICANSTTFHLVKKGGKNFQHKFSNMWGGLAQHFPKNKNDVGFTYLFLRCHSNNKEEIEQIKTTLKLLIYDLTDSGFNDCMLKTGNGYIDVQPLRGTDYDYTDISINFKWTGIEDIQLVENHN